VACNFEQRFVAYDHMCRSRHHLGDLALQPWVALIEDVDRIIEVDDDRQSLIDAGFKKERDIREAFVLDIDDMSCSIIKRGDLDGPSYHGLCHREDGTGAGRVEAGQIIVVQKAAFSDLEAGRLQCGLKLACS
jgi:hypothetical protein